MKPILFTLLCIALVSCASPKQQEKNDSTMNKNNNELTAFNVQKEFQKNGFDWFTENLILCSGDTSRNNAMTIGWGGIGNYLGHDRPDFRNDTPKKWYDGFDAGIHTVYIGEVIGAWKR